MDMIRTGSRDRIAEALLDHLSRTAAIRPSKDGALAFMPEVTDAERWRITDAVLAVLSAGGPATPGTCGHRSSEGHPCGVEAGHLGYHRNVRLGGLEWTSWVGDEPMYDHKPATEETRNA